MSDGEIWDEFHQLWDKVRDLELEVETLKEEK